MAIIDAFSDQKNGGNFCVAKKDKPEGGGGGAEGGFVFRMHYFPSQFLNASLSKYILPKCIIPKSFFSKCIHPKLIFAKYIFQVNFSKVYLSKLYFCEIYPTRMSSKFCEFIFGGGAE